MLTSFDCCNFIVFEYSLDGVDAAEMVQKEKLARQLATRLASIERPSDCPLFEHFLVFGQSNKKTDTVKPTCIFNYPPEKPLTLQALEQFVFPTGFPADRDVSRAATSVLEYHAKNPQNAFVLLLTTSIKEVFYAICVIDDFLKPYPTFAETSLSSGANASQVGSTSGHVPSSSTGGAVQHGGSASTSTKEGNVNKLTWSTRCYCLITRYPMFDLMFDVLLHLLDVEEKSLTLPASHRNGELNQVNRILKHLWSTLPPLPGSSINLGIPRIPNYTRPVRHEDEYLISSHCVPTLFWCLDKDLILTLVSAALLERKIVFAASNLRILSNSILSFIALLKPFVLQCVFIPVLPDELLQIAEAPVPFIAGLANPKLIKQAREANPELIVVDLGAKKVYIPAENSVPPLPNVRNLAHAIDPYVQKLKKSYDKYVPPYKATKLQKDLTTELLRLLEQYITPYFEAFRRHCITSLTDNVTIFVKETYLMEETDNTSIDFFLPFLETQIFAYWCDLKLKEIDNQRQSRYARRGASVTGSSGSMSTFNSNSSITSSADSIQDFQALRQNNEKPRVYYDDLDVPSSSGGALGSAQSLPNASAPLSASSSLNSIHSLSTAQGIPRPLSSNDLASMDFDETASHLLELQVNPPRGLGSPSVSHRSRSASLTTATSSSFNSATQSASTGNDAFVASLQFDFSSLEPTNVGNDSNKWKAAVPANKNDDIDTFDPFAPLSSSTSIPTATSSLKLPLLSSSDTKVTPRPKSANLSAIKED